MSVVEGAGTITTGIHYMGGEELTTLALKLGMVLSHAGPHEVRFRN